MHACLQISEILKVIFADVTQVTGSGGVRPLYVTLYHLALTCRAFQELALDALWAHIQTPDVLVMCLPQDARSQPVKLTRRDRVMSGMFRYSVRLLRPLADDDWASFQKYAPRVRSLTFEEDDTMRLRRLHDNAALALLDSHASPSLPFPLLRELYWYDKRDVLLPCLQRCISATLTRLVIHSKLWPSAMVDLVAGLGKACPKIKEFRCSMPPASACAMLSDLVACWDDLEILETGAVNAQALRYLASLKPLRELKMLVPEGHSLDPTSTSSVIFSLEKFSITAARIELLLAFLAPLQISAKSVQLNIDTAPNAVDLDHLLSSLPEHFTPSVLESLGVRVDRPVHFDDHALFELTASAFRKIRVFTGLTNLDLSSMHISITDDEVLDLVSAWPQMEHLYLATDWDWGVTRLGVTFRGLAGILERCPNLRSLGVNLDTLTPHDSPVYVDNQYTGITREKVAGLDVGYAECNDVAAIGNLLAGMCPNLSYISRARPVDLDYEDPSNHNEWFEGEEKWKEVQECITQRRTEQLE
ncbi:hypothetical protein DEU56DRAFT_452830 [Suillus clintonianus]|uniref:uncharacterized protein n=1 Tax=Suillus clintonianus TaxID=1904413 RepID=UPI001B868B3E|nr:uncharacterized protein DEU56DRAFT_452830 [Suillus clintonianus]KAG2131826.1 hypothetical protein DEU56DRAFT_452830 [Suillus clintonianus]